MNNLSGASKNGRGHRGWNSRRGGDDEGLRRWAEGGRRPNSGTRMWGSSWLRWRPNSFRPSPPVLPFLALPAPALKAIFSNLDGESLGRLGLVSKQMRDHVLHHLEDNAAVLRLFWCLRRCQGEEGLVLYSVAGIKDIFNINHQLLRPNFGELGLMIKRLTCLFPAHQRMEVACQLLRRITIVGDGGSNLELMTGLGVYIHSLTKGWQQSDCQTAGWFLLNFFPALPIIKIIQTDYILGSAPQLEIFIKNLLQTVFVREVNKEARGMWVKVMVELLVPTMEPPIIARLLLLLTAVVKGQEPQIAWCDHAEAIPASYNVVTYRYQLLTRVIQVLDHGHFSRLLMKILDELFKIPSPWIPENIGSFFLLAGTKLTRNYLNYLVEYVSRHCDGRVACRHCFAPVGRIFTGLLLMEARMRRPLEWVYSRMDELMGHVAAADQPALHQALWAELAEEMINIRNGGDSDWSEEGALHLWTVIRQFGMHLTVKSYLHKAKLEPELPLEDGCLNEE